MVIYEYFFSLIDSSLYLASNCYESTMCVDFWVYDVYGFITYQLKHAFKFHLRYNHNHNRARHGLRMERREFLRNFPRGIIIGVAAAHVFISSAWSLASNILTNTIQHKKNPTDILKEMYKEVVELGPYENEDFIKREFHIELDSDENNSEEHVVFLIQGAGDKEKMIIQVTYFEAKRTRLIKYAKDIKTILCHIKGDRIEIKKCDYSENDIKSLFPDILQGIRNKKKYLKLLDCKDKR